MARSINVIQSQILTSIANDPTLSTKLTSVSQVAIYNLWAYITAVALNQEEILNDQFIAANEIAISSNPPANTNWVYNYVLYFQYSSTTPQLIQLNTTTLIPEYPIVNKSLNLITRCAIVNPYVNANGLVVGTPGSVIVKVAKGFNPSALSPTELSAFQTYLNIIKPAGVIYKAVSVDGDRLFTNMFIYYNGAYAGTIQNDVYTAYTTYLSNIVFDGIFKLSDLENALKNVTGVVDLEFINVGYRQATYPFGTNNIVNNYTQLAINSKGIGLAGYIVDEDTAGNDFLTINANNFIQQ